YSNLKASTALNFPALARMDCSTGGNALGSRFNNGSTVVYRSATQGPSYNSAASSLKGEKSIFVISAPSACQAATALANAASAWASPKNSSLSGTASRGAADRVPGTGEGNDREYGSDAS